MIPVFLHLGDLRLIGDLLEARIKKQAEAIRKVAILRRQLSPLLATGGLHLLDHLNAQRRLDQKFPLALRRDVIAGAVHDVADPRRLGVIESKRGPR